MDLQRLVEVMKNIHRLRREAIDARFGEIEAVMVAGGNEIDKEQNSKKQERVENRTDAVLRRTLAKKGRERALGRREESDDGEGADYGVSKNITGKITGDEIGDSGKKEKDNSDYTI